MKGIEIKIINTMRQSDFKPHKFQVELAIEPEVVLSEDIRNKILSGEGYEFDEEYDEEPDEQQQFLELVELIQDIAKMSKAFNKEVVWYIKRDQMILLFYYCFYNQE